MTTIQYCLLCCSTTVPQHHSTALEKPKGAEVSVTVLGKLRGLKLSDLAVVHLYSNAKKIRRAKNNTILPHVTVLYLNQGFEGRGFAHCANTRAAGPFPSDWVL